MLRTGFRKLLTILSIVEGFGSDRTPIKKRRRRKKKTTIYYMRYFSKKKKKKKKAKLDEKQ